MGAPCHLAVSIGALIHHLLAAVTTMLFRAVAKMIYRILELRAMAVAAPARQHKCTGRNIRHWESGCVS